MSYTLFVGKCQCGLLFGSSRNEWHWNNYCAHNWCCPLPGSVQGQAGRGFEQPGLVEGVPARGRGVGTRWFIRLLPIKPSYNSTMSHGHKP